MTNYNFTTSLSPIDFELLSKDLIEVDLGISLENFSEGRDQGIDLRYAPIHGTSNQGLFPSPNARAQVQPPALIVQCKRYSNYSDLKNSLRTKELPKIIKLNPARYILTTSVSLTPMQVQEIETILAPYIKTTGDIYSSDRLNSLLSNHPEIERRNIKLWATSAGVLDSIINAGTHLISREEVERTLAAAKIYVRNKSFDEALEIIKKHRVCIISGLPGIGKTTLARILLLYFFERKFDVIKITGDISEARAVGYHSNPRFYYYDDFLGQTAQADKLNKNEDQRLLDFMASVKDSKESVFILTTREYILNQARLHYEKLSREKFDHRTCIIDLSKYSRRIRAQILYNHLHFSKLPTTHLEAFVATRCHIRIVDHPNYNPRLIEYLTDSDWIGNIQSADYPGLFLRKLNNPVEIWDHAFRNQLSDKSRHLLFVLTTMPQESRMMDIQRAFETFHLSHCREFGIPHSIPDFTMALKELDGTFIASRCVQGTILIRFQNPSIRDFMQILLLGGECLENLLRHLAFFEQARWFSNTLCENSPQFPVDQIRAHFQLLLEALKSLIDTASCSISIEGTEGAQRCVITRCNPATRLAEIAEAFFDEKNPVHTSFMSSQILNLAAELDTGHISAALCLEAAGPLHNFGHLNGIHGETFLNAFRNACCSTLCDLDDFETSTSAIDSFPDLFCSKDVENIQSAYTDFADDYATACSDGSADIDDPETLREEASRIKHIGDLLKVDTQDPQKRIKDYAKKIESEAEEHRDRDYDDDDRPRGGGSPNECSDREIDSMFGTLSG